jgi:hypothetical protein
VIPSALGILALMVVATLIAIFHNDEPVRVLFAAVDIMLLCFLLLIVL